MARTATALVVALVLVAACSQKPQSQATEQTAAPGSTPVAATPAPTGAIPSAAPPAATAAATPEPTPEPVPGVPPKPGSPTWTLVKSTPVKATGGILEQYRITWTSPEGVADQFLVYGVKGCLRESKQHDGKPCVVKGMPIPKDTLRKLGTVPGDAREMEVTIELPESGPGPYGAILIRAVNETGKSIFTIVHSEDVCWHCTY